MDGALNLPEGMRGSFWLRGSTWQVPDYENADTFVERLVRDGSLVSDPSPPGSEPPWAGSIIPYQGGSLEPVPDGYLKYLGYPIGEPASSVATFQFTAAEFRQLIPEGVLGDAMSLDLDAFREAGGKLIMWHGWADRSISPAETLDYYQRLWEREGGLDATRRFARLYMVPTLFHCAFFGGYRGSTRIFDPIPALVRWVETGKAPDGIIATQSDDHNVLTRTRPVFPYPEGARYTGQGSIDDAGNFVAAPPLTPPRNVVHWLGDDLYGKPGPVVPG